MFNVGPKFFINLSYVCHIPVRNLSPLCKLLQNSPKFALSDFYAIELPPWDDVCQRQPPHLQLLALGSLDEGDELVGQPPGRVSLGLLLHLMISSGDFL